MGSLVGTRCRSCVLEQSGSCFVSGWRAPGCLGDGGTCGRLSLQKVQGPWGQAHGRHHCCVSLLETECFRSQEGTPGRIVYPYDFKSI